MENNIKAFENNSSTNIENKIIKTGDGMLADEIESEGYAKYLL